MPNNNKETAFLCCLFFYFFTLHTKKIGSASIYEKYIIERNEWNL